MNLHDIIRMGAGGYRAGLYLHRLREGEMRSLPSKGYRAFCNYSTSRWIGYD